MDSEDAINTIALWFDTRDDLIFSVILQILTVVSWVSEEGHALVCQGASHSVNFNALCVLFPLGKKKQAFQNHHVVRIERKIQSHTDKKKI